MNRFCPRMILAAAAVAVLSYLPALADTRIEKTLKLDSGGKLTLLADAGSVTVTGSSSSGARVVLTSDKNDFDSRFDLKFEELPGELRITLKKKESLSSWSSWFNNSKIRFEIQVPTKTSTDLKTGGGHVKLLSMEGVNLSVTKDGIRALAEQAVTKGTGARALRSMFERIMPKHAQEILGERRADRPE